MALKTYIDSGKAVFARLWKFKKLSAMAIAEVGGIVAFLPKLTTAWWGPWVLVLAPVSLTGAVAIAMVSARNKSLRRKLAGQLVDGLHSRWFSTDTADDRNHRVTLYVPEPNGRNPKTWRCIARSGDGNGKLGCDWPADARHPTGTCGPVVFAATTGLKLDVAGVPGYHEALEDAKARYRQAVRMSDETARARSWPGASMRARVFRAPHGTVHAVIVVECRSGEATKAMTGSQCAIQHSQELTFATNGGGGDAATIDAVCKVYNPLIVELDLAAAVAQALWED